MQPITRSRFFSAESAIERLKKASEECNGIAALQAAEEIKKERPLTFDEQVLLARTLRSLFPAPLREFHHRMKELLDSKKPSEALQLAEIAQKAGIQTNPWTNELIRRAKEMLGTEQGPEAENKTVAVRFSIYSVSCCLALPQLS
jgi:hypothetical protein